MISDPRLITLSDQDNVCVLAEHISAGEKILISGTEVLMSQTLGMGHKLSNKLISKGSDVLKYGFPIGFASADIPLGAHVHIHNLTSRHTVVEIME